MTCKDCVWATWQRTRTGRIKKDMAGRCTYIVELPPLPYAMLRPNLGKKYIWTDSGESCPCYEQIVKPNNGKVGAEK